MKKRVADIVMEVLVNNGITDCFAVVGGGAMHIDNALAKCDEMNKIFCHHEQTCAMAAEGYAKASGRMALVSVTSGPGALNTFNGVQGAWVDNIPMIIIAGFPRYDTSVEPTGLALRCRGVQEFDAVSAVQGFTKYAKLVTDPLAIRKEIEKAIDIANSGRKGPVWISIPLDVQSAIVEEQELYSYDTVITNACDLSDEVVTKINEMIKYAERPCILTGSGIRSAGAIELFRLWVTKVNVPIVGGALQPDIMYEGAHLYYGMSGAIGPRKGNFIIQESDLIIVIGNSLSTKQTGFNQDLFAPNAKIIMIDVDSNEMEKPGLHIDYKICVDAKSFFEFTMSKITKWKTRMEWITYCESLDDIIGDIDEPVYESMSERISYKSLAKTTLDQMKEDAVLALGNSNGIAGFLQNDVKTKYQKTIVNYNTGSMGDDITEAIGVSVALKKEVICATGDGSFMMNIQELQTIKHYNLPIKIIVMSNEGYGALRQTNKNFFDGTYIGCDATTGVSFPDFSKIAFAFGYEYIKAENIGELEEKMKEFMCKDGNSIFEVFQKLDDPVLPKVASKMNEDGTFNTPALHQMFPYIDDVKM